MNRRLKEKRIRETIEEKELTFIMNRKKHSNNVNFNVTN